MIKSERISQIADFIRNGWTLWLLVLVVSVGAAQPLAALIKLRKIENFLRLKAMISTSNSPYGVIGGYDFNIQGSEKMAKFTFTDGSNWETSFTDLTQSLDTTHRERIYWTFPLMQFAIFRNASAEKILKFRFCSQSIDPRLAQFKSRNRLLEKVELYFNTKPNPIYREISCN
jgi:hypothetical protein